MLTNQKQIILKVKKKKKHKILINIGIILYCVTKKSKKSLSS